ncbi:MAG TPA: replication-relaxation family protein [Actinophytocola sp.]|uniref:replication-relaxation family protein n=1 Tax=Actinophytocola sp. TaxID=1872138 RepID=UPI002DDD7CFD|nr:replication-relaxation family protein [Actinophytocola sp.]HEV2782559.1 replication-relaxation family protein [Actinophytocola sp.]
MTDRDWQIVREVNRVRIASGEQLERLCFASVATGRSRTATRSRAVGRLVRWRVLAPIGRRIGGQERGSTAQVYALDTIGQRLLAGDQLAAGAPIRVRRPGPPGVRSLRHLLAVAELYTQLVEQARTTGLELVTFKAEPAAHWPDGKGGRLKPDAYAVLGKPGARDHWWIEVDLATESLPTVRAKLQTYLDFQRRGERDPGDVTPWVLVATSTECRRDAIRAMVRRLPEAAGLITIVTSGEAAQKMYLVLRE